MKDVVTVIVPTYNAGNGFYEFCKMLKKQTANIKQIIVIDSSSTDDTAAIAREEGFTVKRIDNRDFGHGKTRQIALEMAETDIVCYLTQDAVLAEESSVEKLIRYLTAEDSLGAVYGRQLPYEDAGVLGSFSRFYNYPDHSFITTFEDRKRNGIKTAFFSNVFSAYKKKLVLQVGGFPLHSNFGEDSYVAAKMLMAGYKTGYCAEAKVYHSHNYSLRQEWKRTKRIKDFHSTEPWILEVFGKPEGEGVRFVVAQIKWLLARGELLSIPSAIVSDMVKYAGYRLG